MNTEWISLLGLDGDQPPWDGEPKEIRGKILIGEDEVRVKIIDLICSGEVVEVNIEIVESSCEEVNLAESFTGRRVDIKEVDQITVVY